MALFAVADAIREEAREAVDTLHALGLQAAMPTGDAQAVADAVVGTDVAMVGVNAQRVER